jgi:hypothetical protein
MENIFLFEEFSLRNPGTREMHLVSKDMRRKITMIIQDGRIKEIRNEGVVGFPFKEGQMLHRNIYNWCCNNHFTIDGEDPCPEEKIYGIRKSDIPHGHPLRMVYPSKFRNESLKKIEEAIEPSEAYTEEGSLDTIISGKRDIGTLFRPDFDTRIKVESNGLKIRKIEKNPQDVYIVYRPGSEERVEELLAITDKYDGYLSYKATKEETVRIGQILGYSQDSINKFISEKY